MWNDFFELQWELLPEPVVSAVKGPLVADPSVILPEDSLDGNWHMFCHSLRGGEHYISSDGRSWKHSAFLFPAAMRLNVVKADDGYYLFYERPKNRYSIAMSMLPVKWNSRIEVRKSEDLVHWSTPRTVLPPTLDWHVHSKFGRSVSNPFVLKDDRWRLYYSASLAMVPDCGFREPLHIGLAFSSEGPEGPYHPMGEPILSPDNEHPWINLCCGALKVYKFESDKYLGLQNGIYWNEDEKKSGSSILALTSTDGIHWTYQTGEPLLAPGRYPWMASHVYALDCRYVASEKAWYLYFNGRNTAHWTKGREKIGLMIGRRAQS